jgi:hypothetical protein
MECNLPREYHCAIGETLPLLDKTLIQGHIASLAPHEDISRIQETFTGNDTCQRIMKDAPFLVRGAFWKPRDRSYGSLHLPDPKSLRQGTVSGTPTS